MNVPDAERRARHFSKLEQALDQGAHLWTLSLSSDTVVRQLGRFVIRSSGFLTHDNKMVDIFELWDCLDPQSREELLAYMKEEM